MRSRTSPVQSSTLTPVALDMLDLLGNWRHRRAPRKEAMNYLRRLTAFNSTGHRLWQENAAFAEAIPNGALILDAGAGDAPYKSLFQHASDKYCVFLENASA